MDKTIKTAVCPSDNSSIQDKNHVVISLSKKPLEVRKLIKVFMLLYLVGKTLLRVFEFQSQPVFWMFHIADVTRGKDNPEYKKNAPSKYEIYSHKKLAGFLECISVAFQDLKKPLFSFETAGGAATMARSPETGCVVCDNPFR